MTESSHSLEIRYQEILKQISTLRDSVTLIAVSKGQPIEKIEALYRLGHRDFGENYVQELLEKAIELRCRGCSEIRWHFIGHLQSNKVKVLLPHISVFHTIDSHKIAVELAKYWPTTGQKNPLPVFIQINIDQEETKNGLSESDLPNLIEKIRELPQLDLQGLMCIPDANQNTRNAFMRLRRLEKQFQPATRGKLSMGMSEDFQAAIEEGSTHIRVGSALFGAR